jgi:hypothetical protein
MFAGRLGIRRFTIVLVRSAHVLRHHYVSIVSAILLVGALLLGLTSSSFDDGGASRPASVGSSGTAHSVVGASDVSILTTVAPPTRQHQVVFYLVDSDGDRLVLESAIVGDAAYLMENHMPDSGIDVHFYYIRDAQEESNVLHILREISQTAALEGFNFRVIDLR